MPLPPHDLCEASDRYVKSERAQALRDGAMCPFCMLYFPEPPPPTGELENVLIARWEKPGGFVVVKAHRACLSLLLE
jgi:hypothetical protein